MRTGALAVAVVVALALAVPMIAMTHGGEDDVDGKVTIAPADGPNGEYATVEDGELRVDFDRLNETMYHQPTRRIRSISNENQIYTTVVPLATHDDS